MVVEPKAIGLTWSERITQKTERDGRTLCRPSAPHRGHRILNKVPKSCLSLKANCLLSRIIFYTWELQLLVMTT